MPAVLQDMELVRHGGATGAAVLASTAALASPPQYGSETRERAAVPGSGSGVVRPDLDEIFRREYRLVVGVAARVLNSPDQAEDIAQEVVPLLRVVRRCRPGRPAAGSASPPRTPR
jgi:RNA polymerase sigma-70 factor (ECF subfamily)